MYSGECGFLFLVMNIKFLKWFFLEKFFFSFGGSVDKLEVVFELGGLGLNFIIIIRIRFEFNKEKF